MILTLLATISSLLVVTSTSTVYSVLWLVTTFILVSIVFGLLNLGFTALLYIIVYVGAIAILFLFVVQLLDLGSVTEITSKREGKTGTSLVPLASVITVSLATILVITGQVVQNVVQNTDRTANRGTALDMQYNASAHIDPVVSTVSLDALQLGNTHVHAIAEWLYGPGLLPLVIVSIILLVAMIAPIYLCKE